MSAQAASPERLIYLAAHKLQDPKLREEFLADACGSDVELRKRMGLLLTSSVERQDPLNDALKELGHAEPKTQTDEVEPHETHPSVRPESGKIDETVDARIDVSKHPIIGRYKLLEELGQGGMGTVYMAHQTAPVKRKVALKIIKPGMDSREVIARFQAERQALAMMDHSNIARVLDAGTTEQGRPYFVMELVRGIPITKFCDEKNLSLEDRLKLFIDVCKAVQHAHQKAIIHRDLKPSNILVTLHDGEPVAKVIDFGVAKALNQELTEQTLFTQFAQMIGTPLYMSPEQAEMSGLDMDTRSDIYSLGVVLYELLTGTTPIERESLANVGIDAVRRMVVEQEAERPSSRISTLKAMVGSTVAEKKKVRSQIVTGQLKSELDWIVLKALEKDRTRRYETANAFAADVQRYLDGETVQACPPSVIYRLRKSFRRNRTAVVTSTLVLMGILVGAGFAVWKAMEADAERVIANEQRELADQSFEQSLAAVEQMLQRVASETLVNTPETIAVRRELYDDAIQFYRNLGKLRPDDTRAMGGLASTYELAGQLDHHTQRFNDSLNCFDSALAIRSSLCELAPNAEQAVADLAMCMRLKASLLNENNRGGEAFALCERAVGMLKGNSNRFQWACCVIELASSRGRFNNNTDTERILLAAIPALALDEEGLTHRNWEHAARAFLKLGRIQKDMRQYEKARRNLCRAVEINRQAVDRQFELLTSLHELRLSLNELGNLYLKTGQQEAALKSFAEAWTISIEHSDRFPNWREFHWFVASGESLIRTYQDLGRIEEAQILAANCHPEDDVQAFALARVYQLLGEEDKFLEYMQRVLAGDLARDGSSQLFRARLDFTSVNFRLGEFETALESLWQTCEVLETVRQTGSQKLRCSAVFTWIPAGRLVTCDNEEFKQGYLELIDRAVSESKGDVAFQMLNVSAHLALDEGYDREFFERDLQFVISDIKQRKSASSLKELKLSDFSSCLSYARRCCLAAKMQSEARQFSDVLRPILERVSKLTKTQEEIFSAPELNNLAWFVVALPSSDAKHIELAVELARKAVDMDDHKNPWNTLGVAQYRVRDYDSATKSLKRSMELGGDADDVLGATNKLFLAMSYHGLEQWDEAEHWYSKATTTVDLHPADRELAAFQDEAKRLFESQSTEQHVDPTAAMEEASAP